MLLFNHRTLYFQVVQRPYCKCNLFHSLFNHLFKKKSCSLFVECFSPQGYYDTADSGYRDAEGYVAVMARTDDIINVAGHRLSTSALEEVRAAGII